MRGACGEAMNRQAGEPVGFRLTVMTREDTPNHESHDRLPLFPDPSPARGEGNFVSR
jgi:hypothetical protein